MLQNPCKTLGFKKNMVYKIPLGGGGEVNHIQPVAYKMYHNNPFIQNIFSILINWISPFLILGLLGGIFYSYFKRNF